MFVVAIGLVVVVKQVAHSVVAEFPDVVVALALHGNAMAIVVVGVVVF